MIDPRILRDDPDRVRAAQAKRGLSADVVDRALSADTARRESIAAFESARSSAELPPTAGKALIELPTRKSWAKRGGMKRSGSGAPPVPTSAFGGSFCSAPRSRSSRRQPMFASPKSA